MSFPTYTAVPYHTAQNPALLAAVLAKAVTQACRMAWIGDSRSTNPNGNGHHLLPLLDAAFAEHFHNSPGSGLLWNTGGPGSATGYFCGGTVNNTGGTAMRLTPDKLPPQLSFLGANVCKAINNTDANMFMAKCFPRNELSYAYGLIGGNYFPNAGTDSLSVYIDVTVATKAWHGATSGQVFWQFGWAAAATMLYDGAPVTNSGTTALDINNATGPKTITFT